MMFLQHFGPATGLVSGRTAAEWYALNWQLRGIRVKDVDGISVFKESQENVGTPLKFNMEPEK